MATIKFYRAKALPSPVTSAHDGVWYIKKPGDSFFRTYVVKGGVLSQEYLDDLEIGGRNFIIDSSNTAKLGSWFRNNDQAQYNLTLGVDNGVNFMSGFRISNNTFSVSTYFGNTFANGQSSVFSDSLYPLQLPLVQSLEVKCSYPISILLLGSSKSYILTENKWTKLEFELRPTDVRLGGIAAISNPEAPLDTKIFYRNLKLERGTIATDWSPAPEDPREWLADTVSQSEAEAGTATTRRAWTSQRVRQAIDKRLESFPSGIQSLQEVTDIGNETTKQVVLKHATDQTKTTLSYNGGVFNNYIGSAANIPGGKDGEAAHSASLKAAGLRFDADAPHSVHYNRLGIFYRKDLGFLFPSDRTQASTTMMRSVNGVVPDPVSGNVVIDVNAIKPLVIVTNNECITIWENNTRFIYRTSAVCILATTAHEGKEVVVINDRGLAISVSESSSPFNKLLNLGDLFRQSYTDFPPGFIGRFRVISGEFIQIG